MKTNQSADRIFIDRKRRKYYLQVNESTDFFTAKLLYRNSKIGEIKGAFNSPDEFLISDIYIQNNVIHKPSNLLIALWRLIFKPKPIDYRQNGLGTYLLQTTLAIARQNGLKRIYGSLTQEDINNNPNLIRWYKKHGFQVLPPSVENLKNSIYGISMDL
ncbi:MAG: GNAT family N-acetyltransferase [Coleofasciculaceae cyanobacterium SM2_1_6]|nr:GNAT family N-acetyltransferase [Coleofasciculaceae cyanobacterium SM2_1_6]